MELMGKVPKCLFSVHRASTGIVIFQSETRLVMVFVLERDCWPLISFVSTSFVIISVQTDLHLAMNAYSYESENVIITFK